MKLQIDTQKEEVSVLDYSFNLQDLNNLMVQMFISHYKVVCNNILNNTIGIQEWVYPQGGYPAPIYPYGTPVITPKPLSPPWTVTC